MIKEIVIHNFQSHKHTVLKLSDGLNAIVGESSFGKTAVIRAIEWVLTNRPLGDEYVSHFADKKDPTYVKITTDRGWVKATRQATSVGYEVNGQYFDKVGRGVPDAVKSVLNIGDSNIQEQLAPHFLLSGTTSITDTINRITNLELITECRKEANRDISKLKTEIKLHKESLAETESRLNQLRPVDDLLEKAEKHQMLVTEIADLQDDLETIFDIQTDVLVLERAIDGYDPDLDVKFNVLIETLDEIETMKKLLAYLEAERRFQTTNEHIAGIVSVFNKLGAVVNEMNTMQALFDSMVGLQKVEEQIAVMTRRRDTAINRYTKFLEDEGKCPTCFAKITKDRVHEIRMSV